MTGTSGLPAASLGGWLPVGAALGGGELGKVRMGSASRLVAGGPCLVGTWGGCGDGQPGRGVLQASPRPSPSQHFGFRARASGAWRVCGGLEGPGGG